MRAIIPGYRYALANHMAAKEPGGPLGMNPHQSIQFLQMRKARADETMFPGALKLIQDGTTNEEVLAMLIERTEFLNGLFPCEENIVALALLKGALGVFNARTAKRAAAGVEGKALPMPQGTGGQSNPELAPKDFVEQAMQDPNHGAKALDDRIEARGGDSRFTGPPPGGAMMMDPATVAARIEAQKQYNAGFEVGKTLDECPADAHPRFREGHAAAMRLRQAHEKKP